MTETIVETNQWRHCTSTLPALQRKEINFSILTRMREVHLHGKDNPIGWKNPAQPSQQVPAIVLCIVDVVNGAVHAENRSTHDEERSTAIEIVQPGVVKEYP